MSLTVPSLHGTAFFTQSGVLVSRSESTAQIKIEQCFSIDRNNTADWECPTYYDTNRSCVSGNGNSTDCDAFCSSLASGMVENELDDCTEKLCGGKETSQYKASMKSLEVYIKEMKEICETQSTDRQASRISTKADDKSSGLRLQGGWKAAAVMGLVVVGMVSAL
jgi:hypothetical protein